MDKNPLSLFLRRLQLHSQLSKEDAQAILQLPFKLISRDQYLPIVREGDITRHCAILISGLAARHRTTSKGKRQILAIYIAGDPLDLDHLLLPIADDGLQTLKPSELALIRHEDLHALIAGRLSIAKAFLTTMLVDASVAREWMLNVGQRDARARIAHLLCEIAFRMEAVSVKEVLLPLTQYHIGDATGLTSVHVNRTLKAMQSEGLLKMRAGSIRVPDWKQLREVADFSDHYLHPDYGVDGL